MTTYKLKSNLAVSDNGFVFDPSTGESFLTNQQGQEIINLLNKNFSEQQIKQYFLDNYDIDEITFDRSYLDFIGVLRQFNLIVESNEQN